MIVNHVGLRVRDLGVSTRFYEALGFTEVLAFDVPDEPAGRLLRLTPPVGLRAVYLTNGAFVLELLDFSGYPSGPVERSMAETGLTHISLGVEDMDRARAAVLEHGGEILVDTEMATAVMARDPDGQLIELLDADRRPVSADRGLLGVMLSQRACRQYRPDPVPDGDLGLILEAASHAPSAENSQPWMFVVVDDPDVRASVDDLTRRHWRESGRPHSEASLSRRFFEEVDAFMDGGYGGAPCLVVVAGDMGAAGSRAMLAASLYPAIQNLLLAAGALGYGSAMTTLATVAPGELSGILGLPGTAAPFAVLPIGRPARRLGPPRRRPVEEIAHRNRFGRPFD